MKTTITYPKSFSRVSTTVLIGLLFLVAMVGCGGGGGGEQTTTGEQIPPAENVTISGKVDDGTANSPIPNAVCQFWDTSQKLQATVGSDANGEYRIIVPLGLDGHVRCSPWNLPYLTIYTFSSTKGSSAGGTISGENVSPITTIVADIIGRENPAAPLSRKKELMESIETLTNEELAWVAEMSTMLYKTMYEQGVNVNFSGNGGGGSGDGGGSGNGSAGEGTGASGDAGDGAVGSPIANARCEFIIGNSLREGKVLYGAALADLLLYGQVKRPDLQQIADLVNAALANHTPDQVARAFGDTFPEGIGKPISTVTDENGSYFLPIPPNVPGLVRCIPPDQEKLVLGTYVKGLEVGEKLLYQDVNPATTIFSNNIASKLEGDLSAIKENFLDDITGMEVLIARESGAVKKFQLSGKPEVDSVGLAAFTATSIFNSFYQNKINGDFLTALDQLLIERAVPVAFMQQQGLPPDQAEAVTFSVTEAAQSLPSQPTLSGSVSTSYAIVTVYDIPNKEDRTLVPNATVSIKEIIPADVGCSICMAGVDCSVCMESTECNPCVGSQISAPVTLIFTNVKSGQATEIIVEASAQDFDPVTATAPIVAFSTVNFDIALKDAFKLEVQDAGNGKGFVTSDLGGIDCGTHENEPAGEQCTKSFSSGTSVTLTASPVEGSTFTGWSGDCSGTIGTCTVTMSQARTVTATFSLPTFNLDVQGGGNGAGNVVSSSPAGGINCTINGTAGSGDCNESYNSGTQVTLAGNPASGSNFTGWSGDCSGTSGPCTVTMSQARTVTATFSLPAFNLEVQGGGNGAGNVVSSSPAGGINCTINGTAESGDCNESYNSGASVTLTPTANTGSTFAGWSGGCSGTSGPCTVTMSQERTVTANFTGPLPINYLLDVQGGGNGVGNVVSSSPAGGINCTINGTTGSGDCSESYNSGIYVTLIATPNTGSTFSGWSGCSSSTNSCTVTMSQERTVTANFTGPLPINYLLDVQGGGNGVGNVVSSSPAGGINCTINGTTGSGDCSESYNSGTYVTLIATPNTGSTFSGWSNTANGPPIYGTADSIMILVNNEPQTYFAIFMIPGPPVISNISQELNQVSFEHCIDSLGNEFTGTTFLVNFDYTDPDGDVIKSKGAIVKAGNFDATYFSVFSGDGFKGSIQSDLCYKNANVTVTMTLIDGSGNQSNQLSIYLPNPPLLDVQGGGNGTGKVISSSPAGGIDCTISGTSEYGDCSERYESGTIVTLTPTANSGSTFAGWSGDCSGTSGPCTVTMSQARTVTATFNNLPTFRLTVNGSGLGTGNVSSSPSGINCMIDVGQAVTDCFEDFSSGTIVTLNAYPSGSTFTGWSGGGCSGTSSCMVTMNQARTLTATFTPACNDSDYSVSPISHSFDYYGGSATITVSAPPVCDWTAEEIVPWITIDSGSSGSGNGTVSYTVSASSVTRWGTITVHGQTHTVYQNSAGPQDLDNGLNFELDVVPSLSDGR